MEFEEEPHARVDKERVSISVVTHQGKFRRAIPCMPMALAVFCLICNVLFPGLAKLILQGNGSAVKGTFIAGLSVLCCADRRTETKWGSCATNCLAAVLQLLLTPFLLVGYIWSLIWGILFIQIARKWFISSIDNRYSSLDCCPCSRW